jgi:hypothetical protein
MFRRGCCIDFWRHLYCGESFMICDDSSLMVVPNCCFSSQTVKKSLSLMMLNNSPSLLLVLPRSNIHLTRAMILCLPHSTISISLMRPTIPCSPLTTTYHVLAALSHCRWSRTSSDYGGRSGDQSGCGMTHLTVYLSALV